MRTSESTHPSYITPPPLPRLTQHSSGGPLIPCLRRSRSLCLESTALHTYSSPGLFFLMSTYLEGVKCVLQGKCQTEGNLWGWLSLLPCGSQGARAVMRLDGKLLYPMSHLTGPGLLNLKPSIQISLHC